MRSTKTQMGFCISLSVSSKCSENFCIFKLALFILIPHIYIKEICLFFGLFIHTEHITNTIRSIDYVNKCSKWIMKYCFGLVMFDEIFISVIVQKARPFLLSPISPSCSSPVSPSLSLALLIPPCSSSSHLSSTTMPFLSSLTWLEPSQTHLIVGNSSSCPWLREVISPKLGTSRLFSSDMSLASIWPRSQCLSGWPFLHEIFFQSPTQGNRPCLQDWSSLWS